MQELHITKDDLNEYISIREIENLTPKWIYQIRAFLVDYFEFCDYKISKNITLKYLNSIKRVYHQTTYRKRILQVRKYLRYRSLNWLDSIKIVPELITTPKRVTENDIEATLTYFKGHKYDLQAIAIIMLKITGLRPTEIYRLTENNIDFTTNRIEVYKSKTGEPRGFAH